MSAENKTIQADYEKKFRREKVIDCPHMMALLGYLSGKHKLPRYGWLKKGLRYHYTDAAGLLGIIQEGRVWATDIRFLNDPSEGVFLPDRLLEIMNSQPNKADKTINKIINGIREALHQPRSNYATFCTSLSADGDLLSQWRGYGDFGKGYAIGLDFDGEMPHPQIVSYYDVVYGDEALAELAYDLLDIFVSASNRWKGMLYDEWASTINVLAKSFKNEKYAEEQESRLVCSLSPNETDMFQNELPLKFRPRGSDIVPYIPMSLDLMEDENKIPRLPIDRIVVGPGVDFERNYSSIKTLLDAHSYKDVKIVPSIIPFRP